MSLCKDITASFKDITASFKVLSLNWHFWTVFLTNIDYISSAIKKSKQVSFAFYFLFSPQEVDSALLDLGFKRYIKICATEKESN